MGLFSGVLSSLLGVGYEMYRDSHLTGSQREANAFSESEAEKNRGFQHAEAEIARDWQEQQYLKYNSPAAMVSQYQGAGLNPSLMFGQMTSPASTSTSAPSGDSAASVAPAGGDLVGMIGQLMQLSKLDEEKRSLTLQNESREIENGISREYGMLQAQANYNKAIEEIHYLLEQGNLTRYEYQVLYPAEIALKKAQERNLDAEAFINEWKKSYIEKYGTSPDSPWLTQTLESFLHDLNSPLPQSLQNFFSRFNSPTSRARLRDRLERSTRYRADSMTD